MCSTDHLPTTYQTPNTFVWYSLFKISIHTGMFRTGFNYPSLLPDSSLSPGYWKSQKYSFLSPCPLNIPSPTLEGQLEIRAACLSGLGDVQSTCMSRGCLEDKGTPMYVQGMSGGQGDLRHNYVSDSEN
jgi:hypothetical protein